MRSFLRRVYSGELGQAIVLAMAAFVVLVSVTALALDVGDAYGDKARAQRAADSAAIAAADVLMAGGGASAAAVAAHEWAEENGYGESDPAIGVTVNIPPESGPYAGDHDYVEVIIDHDAQAHFAKAIGFNLWEVQARAVAGGTSSIISSYAIIALNPNQCSAFSSSGNVGIEIINGGIMVNSDCPTDAFHTNGSVEITADVIHVNGGSSVGGDVSPAPSHADPIEDPLADLPYPTQPGGPMRSCSLSKGMNNLQPGIYPCTIDPKGNEDVNFAPGDYLITGGIVVNGQSDITFGSGVYTLRGQGIKLTGGGDITAIGVMFYVEEGAVDITGNGDHQISAPTSGIYAGVSIFQNRDNTSIVDVGGTAFVDGGGTVYAAGSEVRLHGTADTVNVQFICDTFTTVGTVGITIEFDDNFTVETMGALALVE
jgi:hypothetical protein